MAEPAAPGRAGRRGGPPLLHQGPQQLSGRGHRTARAWVLCGLALLAVASCRHTIARRDARDAAGLYALAMEQLAQGALEEATSDFVDLRARFPYSRYAALSELRLADTQVKGGKVVEAIEAFRGFLRAHPQHDQAPYALLQIAEQQAQQLPSDHFLLPPSHERDQAAVVEAAASFDAFLQRYPHGPTADRARAGRQRCRRRLAEHELYVARFYLREGHWQGVCARARAAAAQYQELGLQGRAEQLCQQAIAKAGAGQPAADLRSPPPPPPPAGPSGLLEGQQLEDAPGL